jgi:hypothetical protein
MIKMGKKNARGGGLLSSDVLQLRVLEEKSNKGTLYLNVRIFAREDFSYTFTAACSTLS